MVATLSNLVVPLVSIVAKAWSEYVNVAFIAKSTPSELSVPVACIFFGGCWKTHWQI